MKQKIIMLVTVCTIALLISPAFAKRSTPKTVAPVSKDGIEYSAPLNREGFVVATWIKTKREIWSRQIYVIKHEYKFGLETDVQTCFITKLEMQNGKLKIKNEEKAEFVLDLDTMEVKILSGQAVIDYTNFKPPER
ncbi:MAG: hypothetical protein WCS52_02085 [bacterium]